MLISACIDFWVTKNVTGRYLIGLRWWSASDISSDEDLDNELEEEKEEEGWYFESYPYDVSNSLIDVNIFWFSLCGTAIFWSIFLVLKVLGLSMFWVIWTSYKGNACLCLLEPERYELVCFLFGQKW